MAATRIVVAGASAGGPEAVVGDLPSNVPITYLLAPHTNGLLPRLPSRPGLLKAGTGLHSRRGGS